MWGWRATEGRAQVPGHCATETSATDPWGQFLPPVDAAAPRRGKEAGAPGSRCAHVCARVCARVCVHVCGDRGTGGRPRTGPPLPLPERTPARWQVPSGTQPRRLPRDGQPLPSRLTLKTRRTRQDLTRTPPRPSPPGRESRASTRRETGSAGSGLLRPPPWASLPTGRVQAPSSG